MHELHKLNRMLGIDRPRSSEAQARRDESERKLQEAKRLLQEEESHEQANDHSD